MKAWIARRFPVIAKHFAVLRASWSLQNETDRNRQPACDQEFLPAALEIIEKPPSPGLRALLIMICALFTMAIVWSMIGKVDVVATAGGKLIPSGKVKTIQPFEIGSVRTIHVSNGQHVEAGQILIELDPTLAAAEEEQAQRSLLSAKLVEARSTALLAYLEGQPTDFNAPEGARDGMVAVEQQFVRAGIAEYEAALASLRDQIAQHAATVTSAEAEIIKLQQTLPLVDAQLEARKELARQGNFARLKVLEYEQLRIEHIQNIEVQRANATRARATMTSLEAEMRKLRATFGKTVVNDVSQARDKVDLAVQDLRKATRRREFLQLRAPLAGTVQQLAVTTIGGVVEAAQPLMIIVPDGAEIEVEAHVLNKDIGFVREGQSVRVKLEAFPFTDFGLVPGIVETISRDAIDFSQSNTPQNDARNRPVQPGLVYMARVRLLKNSIEAGGREMPLGPGLSVIAEIKTGERRIIQYLLSPIAQLLDEAGRER